MLGIDIREKIIENVTKTIREYEKTPGMHTRFGEPLIGYADSRNPIFQALYDADLCAHPKEIFRPGYTVIVHFIPFHEDIIKSNKGGNTVSKEWAAAYEDAIMLSTYVNETLRNTLNMVGRITSGTNTPRDWNEETCRPEWSHKYAAYIAGMGEFGTAGSFHTKHGFGGRFGAVISDLVTEPTRIWTEEELADLSRILKSIDTACGYEEAENVKMSKETQAACPAGAITDKGVNRKVCQAFCKQQKQFIPTPDVCGKCYDSFLL